MDIEAGDLVVGVLAGGGAYGIAVAYRPLTPEEEASVGNRPAWIVFESGGTRDTWFVSDVTVLFKSHRVSDDFLTRVVV